MQVFLRLFKHLLPSGWAWRITINRLLRAFFSALSDLPTEVRRFIDNVWYDAFPETTRELDTWERQFGIPLTPSAPITRRERLTAAWRFLGNLGEYTIERSLHEHGFTDAHVHGWWDPGSLPAIVVRDPHDYLAPPIGNGSLASGVLLVNKIYYARPLYSMACGEPLARCGEGIGAAGPSTHDARCGELWGVVYRRKRYLCPVDPNQYGYYLYVSAATFPNPCTVALDRFEEFENLLLKICPSHMWLVLITTP